jgi:ribosomal protein S18 acetylase RimI-like enzyme
VAELPIRRATQSEVPSIASLYLEVAEEVVAREPALRRVPTSTEVERRYGSRIADPGRCVFVAVMDGSVIGFADAGLQHHEDRGTYDRPGIYAYAEEVIVTSAYRRRGAASALMRALERWATNAGARAILLDTHVTNAQARSLYQALGYREMGVILLKEM